MVWLRRVRRAIIVLALVEVGLWLFAGWFGWELRYLMVGPGSPEAINRERLAVATWAGAAVDLLALIPFWSGARWGWSILFLVQIAHRSLARPAFDRLDGLVAIRALGGDYRHPARRLETYGVGCEMTNRSRRVEEAGGRAGRHPLSTM